MKITRIEPIRITPFLNADHRAVAGTSYVSPVLMRRDDSTRIGPLSEYPILLPAQSHGSRVAWVDEDDMERLGSGCTMAGMRRHLPDTDALLTRLRGVAMGVRTADCLPILLYARDIQAVGAVHAGWRGTLGGIAAKAVGELCRAGASPDSIMVRFAPAVCGLCYEVDAELARKFTDAGLGISVVRAPETDPLTGGPFDTTRPHIDLVKANRKLLADAGVPSTNFYQSDLCTRHTALIIAGAKDEKTLYPYHSWRRNPGTTRRNTSFVVLIPR